MKIQGTMMYLDGPAEPVAEQSALSVTRAGMLAQWDYDGQSVIVMRRPDGVVEATFVSHLDTVGEQRAYAMTSEGCKQLVADAAAFFSGARSALGFVTGA